MVKAALIGTIGAIVAVVIVVFIGDAVSGPLLVTPPGADAPEEVAVVAAIFSTFFGGVAGLAIAALCKKFLGNPASVFLGVCVVGLVLYGIVPFVASESVSTGVWLNIMHIAAAIPIVGSLTQALQSRVGQ